MANMTRFEIRELEDDLFEALKKAYRPNAQLRATRQELLQKIDKIDKRLENNKKVKEVLEAKKYAQLEVKKDAKFLRAVEEAATKAIVKRRKQGEDTDETVEKRKGLNTTAKENWLVEFLQKNHLNDHTVASMTKEFKKAELSVSQDFKTWIKPLKLGENCFPWVENKNRKLGKKFIWFNSKRLKDALSTHGIKPPVGK